MKTRVTWAKMSMTRSNKWREPMTPLRIVSRHSDLAMPPNADTKRRIHDGTMPWNVNFVATTMATMKLTDDTFNTRTIMTTHNEHAS